MKKTAKRLLTVLLTVCILIPCLPTWQIGVNAATNIACIEGAKGSDFSNNSYIAQKLTELFELLPYSEYPYFTDYGNKSCGNSMCSHCSLKSTSMNHPNLKGAGIIDTYTSYSCFAFARYAFYYIWGVPGDGLNYYGNPKGSYMQVYNRIGASSGMPSSVQGTYGAYNSIQDLKIFFDKAETGDIIQGMSKYDSSAQKYSNHSMIFLANDADGIYVLQNNAFRTSTDSNGKAFGYNRVLVSYITYTRFMNTWGQLVTDFRARQDIFDAVLAKGEKSCVHHVYTADGDGRCAICNERYSPVLNPADAGMYRAETIANQFTSPYLTAGVKGETAKGSVVEVTASLTNALGQLWYLRSDGTYCYGTSLSAISSDGSVKISPEDPPTNELLYGHSFRIAGKVTSDSTLSVVTGMICRADGTILSRVSVNPGAKSLTLESSDINNKLRFASLATGDYRFMLAAQTSDGKCTFYQSEFTVVGSLDKSKPDAPSAPALEERTAYSVTLETESGYEYSVGGNVWKKTGTFEGLLPMTEYAFYRRLASTTTTHASARSEALIVKTAPPPAQTPAAPTVQSFTDTTVTLTHHSGLEYSLNGSKWQTSPIFTGLSPLTTYSFVCRVAETETNGVSEASEAVKVTTAKKSITLIPSAPVAVDRTVSSITLASAAGYEYRVNGGAWQSEPKFTGLTLNTEYLFTCRIAETATTAASAESPVARIRTTKNPNKTIPKAPTAINVTADSVTLQAVSGYEYSLDGRIWQTSVVFDLLEPNRAYSFYCRIAETSMNDASAASPATVVVTKKLAGKKAAPPTVKSYTATSVTLQTTTGVEYRVDGGEWQSDGYFPGLTPGKHLFTARYAETSTTYAGVESDAIVQYTLPQKLTSSLIPINEELGVIGALKVGMKLTSLIDSLDDANGLAIYRNGKKLTNMTGNAVTGDILRIEDDAGKVYCSYTVIVRGDVSCDGAVNITDMLLTKAHIMEQKILDNSILAAADVSGDGKISILDFLQIKSSILGGENFDTVPIESNE